VHRPAHLASTPLQSAGHICHKTPICPKAPKGITTCGAERQRRRSLEARGSVACAVILGSALGGTRAGDREQPADHIPLAAGYWPLPGVAAIVQSSFGATSSWRLPVSTALQLRVALGSPATSGSRLDAEGGSRPDVLPGEHEHLDIGENWSARGALRPSTMTGSRSADGRMAVRPSSLRVNRSLQSPGGQPAATRDWSSSRLYSRGVSGGTARAS
jgi:hypothetical protein